MEKKMETTKMGYIGTTFFGLLQGLGFRGLGV